MPSSEVMHKFKHGQLHSGSKSGPTVKNRKQAIAIMLSEQRAEKAHGGKYPEKANGGGIGLGMGFADGGGLGKGYQFGGPPNLGNIFERSEARQLMHTGPILSTVGGRTDQHAISVPSGSYVFPAAHVSALGQGNTINGLKVLAGMFGPSIHNPRGMGIPRAAPPRPMPMSNAPAPLPASMRADGGATFNQRFPRSALEGASSSNGPSIDDAFSFPANSSSPLNDISRTEFALGKGLKQKAQQLRGDSAGGRHGSHVGKPVDIMAAGGEYVIGPDQVMRVGGGDLDKGHKILDHWVQKTHKKFAKTVANLPPPAKS